MAQFRALEDRIFPALGKTVVKGEVFEIPDDLPGGHRIESSTDDEGVAIPGAEPIVTPVSFADSLREQIAAMKADGATPYFEDITKAKATTKKDD